MFVKELRLRVDEYYRIVVRTLRVLLFLFRKSFPKTLVTSSFANLNKRCNTLFTTSYWRTKLWLRVYLSLPRWLPSATLPRRPWRCWTKPAESLDVRYQEMSKQNSKNQRSSDACIRSTYYLLPSYYLLKYFRMGERYAVKAGRFEFDSNTKKVRVCREKGEIIIATVLMPACRTKKVRRIFRGWILTTILNNSISSSSPSMLSSKDFHLRTTLIFYASNLMMTNTFSTYRYFLYHAGKNPAWRIREGSEWAHCLCSWWELANGSGRRNQTREDGARGASKSRGESRSIGKEARPLYGRFHPTITSKFDGCQE